MAASPELDVEMKARGIDRLAWLSQASSDVHVSVVEIPPQEIDVVDDSDDDSPREDDDEAVIEGSWFDDLKWKVACSDKVWKFFRDRKFPFHLWQCSIRTIRRIAKGDRSQSLCKPLVGATANIKLFEAKLLKGSRIIWQPDIVYSLELSETPERRLEFETGQQHNATGKRIYFQIIRVRDIVLDHDKIHRSVVKITKSRERGPSLLKLKGLKQNKSNPGNYVKQHLPRIFIEQEEISTKLQSNRRRECLINKQLKAFKKTKQNHWNYVTKPRVFTKQEDATSELQSELNPRYAHQLVGGLATEDTSRELPKLFSILISIWLLSDKTRIHRF